jgi:hypothetical protein
MCKKYFFLTKRNQFQGISSGWFLLGTGDKENERNTRPGLKLAKKPSFLPQPFLQKALERYFNG